MQIPVQFRGFFKTALVASRAKLIYARITLTTHTTIYFIFSVLSCLLLASLHGVILADNTAAVNILYASILPSREEIALGPGLTRVVGDWLQVCDGIPSEKDVQCHPIVDLSGQGRDRAAMTKRSLSKKKRAAVKRRQLKKREMMKRVEAMEKEGVTVDMEEGSEELRKRKRAIMRSAKLSRRQTNSTLPAEPESSVSSSESGNDDAESNSEDESSSSGEEDGAGSADEEENQPSGGIIIRPTGTPTPSSIAVPLPTATSAGGIGASGLPVPTGTGVVHPQPSSRAGILAAQQGIELIFNENCIHALTWLEDGLHDSQREDVTLVFANLWMGVIGVIAVLTESLPHLGVAFFAHILSAGWASSRILHTQALTKMYNTVFVGRTGLCGDHDLLGTWWDLRLKHTIPLVVFNVVAMLVLGYLTWRLFNVYQNQTFSRVGASPAVHRMYKLLLCFSVLLQLTAFFSLASSSLWISRATSPTFMQFAKHWKIYTAMFAIFMLLLLPWVVLGWRCIRKECRVRSVIFFVISSILLVISSVMFASGVYRTIFARWSFFATLTVTSFVLLILTTALGVLCRLNFGKGLAEYLDVSAALDGANFTPVRFDHHPEHKGAREDIMRDTEVKENWTTFNNDSPSPINEKSPSSFGHGRNMSANTFSEVAMPQKARTTTGPGNFYDPTYRDVESQQQQQYGSYQFTFQPASSQGLTPLNLEANSNAQDPFQTAAELTTAEIDRMVGVARASRGESVWSNENSPIKLSYSPTIVRGKDNAMAPPPPPSAFNYASPPGSRRESASTIMPDDSASRVGADSVIDIIRSPLPPTPSAQPGLKSRWSATTVTAMPDAASPSQFPMPPSMLNGTSSRSLYDARVASVMSQYPHPTLMIANPDAYRASLAPSAAGGESSEQVVPPVPAAAVARNASVGGRGMVAAFPVRRSKEM